MAQIDSIERLVELIPDPGPRASAKILDYLDEQALDFISCNPFLIMATDSASALEISLKGDEAGFVLALGARTQLIPERVPYS